MRLDRALIVARTPLLEDKGVVWFRKQERNIIRARFISTFWNTHALVLHVGAEETPDSIVNKLIDLGYERTPDVERPGSCTKRGGIVAIVPINTGQILHVECTHRTITSIWTGEQIASHAKASAHEKKFAGLVAGDYVVHRDHGIGKWNGIIERSGTRYFAIAYAPPQGRTESDMLYVPESAIEKLTPYIGFRNPTVHRLGTTTWERTVKKTSHDAALFARSLLESHARRELSSRPAIHIDHTSDRLLASGASFDRTRAQVRVITEIFHDMSRARPMNRLLIGDVGFGKTEAALASALQMALAGAQVAILVPTTVLAEQHAETFSSRLAEFPVRVARLSRLESPAEERAVIKGLADGTIDICIGTHRMLSADVRWKKLGLLIVDEEQRFGVKVKETLKTLAHSCDVLTMSATPLPRTLSMAISDLTSMSALDEAPEGRIAPHTFVLPYNSEMVTTAIKTEIGRGGQVYVLANHIRKMAQYMRELSEHLPGVRFGMLHGQLDEKEIARVMHAFRAGEIDALISTTIIENGIDLANANTLIVRDASLLGLAEAHQLRGRIGRGNVESFAYFFYPRRLTAYTSPEGPMEVLSYLDKKETPKSLQRLDALEQTQFLGAGADIAYRDLEMRGAGNILGREQSGSAGQVGLHLYTQLLEEAVRTLRGKK